MNPFTKQVLDFVAYFRLTRWSQSLFLLAALLLFCAPFLGWGPNFNPNAFPPQADEGFFRFYGIEGQTSNLDWLLNPPGPEVLEAVRSWQLFRLFPTFLLFIAGLLVFAYSILPDHRLRRRWWLVFALILLSLTVTWLRLLTRVYAAGSVLEAQSERLSRVVAEVPFLVVALGAGWYATLLGLVLLTVAVLLLRRGLTTVPVKFANAGSSEHESPDEVAWFSVIVLGAIGVMSVAISILSLLGFWEQFGSQWLILVWVFYLLVAVVSNGFPAFCGWAFFSKTWKGELRGLFRSCGWRPLAVGVAVPVLILGLSRLVHYTVSEPSWRTDWHSDQAGPWFTVLATSLGYFPFALLEELGWRGYLQLRLIRLFGLSRGIFLVGLLWGVYHLPGDLSSGSSLGWASYAVLVRLVGAVAYTVPLAWLLLRTRSIMPGSVMHGTINYLHFAVAPLLPAWQWGGDWLGILLWAAVGYLMFKRWPPNVRASTLDSSQALTG